MSVLAAIGMVVSIALACLSRRCRGSGRRVVGVAFMTTGAVHVAFAAAVLMPATGVDQRLVFLRRK